MAWPAHKTSFPSDAGKPDARGRRGHIGTGRAKILEPPADGEILPDPFPKYARTMSFAAPIPVSCALSRRRQ